MAGRELSKEYWAWRKAVVKRDGGKCQFPNCKRRGKEVHHIINWCYSASLRFEVSNGILLCKKCHYSIKGKENMYAEMFRTIIAQQKNKKK